MVRVPGIRRRRTGCSPVAGRVPRPGWIRDKPCGQVGTWVNRVSEYSQAGGPGGTRGPAVVIGWRGPSSPAQPTSSGHPGTSAVPAVEGSLATSGFHFAGRFC